MSKRDKKYLIGYYNTIKADKEELYKKAINLSNKYLEQIKEIDLEIDRLQKELDKETKKK